MALRRHILHLALRRCPLDSRCARKRKLRRRIVSALLKAA